MDLASGLTISAETVEVMVQALFMIIEREIVSGHKVSVPGLGQIFIRQPEMHSGYDFTRKIQIPIDPENLVLKFYPDPDVYFAVDGNAPSTDDNDEIE